MDLDIGQTPGPRTLTPIIARTKPWSVDHPSVRLKDRDGAEMDSASPLLNDCIPAVVENTFEFPWVRTKGDGVSIRNGGSWLHASPGSIVTGIEQWYDNVGRPRSICLDIEPHNACSPGSGGLRFINDARVAREYAHLIGDHWKFNEDAAILTLSQFRARTGAEVMVYDPMRWGIPDDLRLIADVGLVPLYLRKEMGPNDWPEFARSAVRRMKQVEATGLRALPIVYGRNVNTNKVLNKGEAQTVQKVVSGVFAYGTPVYQWCDPDDLGGAEVFAGYWEGSR